MNFEWDARKAAQNRRKHGVSFEEAREAVVHPLAITVQDVAHSNDEDREKTIGPSARGRLLVVVHAAPRGGAIRIISARRASRREVIDYAEEVRKRLATE